MTNNTNENKTTNGDSLQSITYKLTARINQSFSCAVSGLSEFQLSNAERPLTANRNDIEKLTLDALSQFLDECEFIGLETITVKVRGLIEFKARSILRKKDRNSFERMMKILSESYILSIHRVTNQNTYLHEMVRNGTRVLI
jgi:hypothetical protein